MSLKEMTTPIPITLSCGFSAHEACACSSSTIVSLIQAAAKAILSTTCTYNSIAVDLAFAFYTEVSPSTAETLQMLDRYGPLVAGLACLNSFASSPTSQDLCPIFSLAIEHAKDMLNLGFLQSLQSALIHVQQNIRYQSTQDMSSVLGTLQSECPISLLTIERYAPKTEHNNIHWKKVRNTLAPLLVTTSEGAQPIGQERADAIVTLCCGFLNHPPIRAAFVKENTSISAGQLLSLLASMLTALGYQLSESFTITPPKHLPCFFSIEDQVLIAEDPDFLLRNFATAFLIS